ncbi:Acetylxylan esterase precursor [Symmachiella macrocystis]|uniref:Acetylxylan esterase n=1 Tax=Symmachiella macrocystis TaxID=2527985 RepID=A0A5C6BFM8_9PLAN|nr:alpha/beta hydrolase [Symmachiella macrocystis]TWU09234.1 Acetylxylan esterase precursor [Symmachiella macrocystis]
MRWTCIVASVLVLAMAGSAAAQRDRKKQAYPPTLDGATVEVYKTVGDVALNMYEYFPEGHKPTDRRPAIVFFFGGGWRGGSPKQFEKQCQYLASRGMVAMAADYRVLSRQKVKADRCVADAKSAVRWIRENAERLGVDPERIVASGGSAGGHIAACTGTITELDEQHEDVAVSSQPNAMILFNPAVVLAPVNGEFPVRNSEQLPKRTGVEPKRISPYHHIRTGVPPTLILHGEADDTVKFQTVQWFTDAMQEAGNRCELASYAEAGHGFFNYGRKGNRYFSETMHRVDQFLQSLKYLQGEATIEEFVSGLNGSGKSK